MLAELTSAEDQLLAVLLLASRNAALRRHAGLRNRMATAVAVSETELAVIDRHRFLFLVHETPMFALSVMSTMADRFRNQV